MESTNYSQQPYIPVIQETEEVRAEFIRRTYTHVALAVLGFILVEALFLQIPAIVNFGLSMISGWSWLLLLGGFMFATNYATRMAYQSTDRNKQYLALLIYVVAEAFIFVPLIYIGIAASGGSLALINQAAILTLALFMGLSMIVFLTKKDFSPLRNIISVGMWVAIGLVVAGMLFGFNLGLWFSFAMVGLAAGAILYQTSSILHEHHTEQYVAASLGLFSALMLLFWYVLNIVMSFSGD